MSWLWILQYFSDKQKIQIKKWELINDMKGQIFFCLHPWVLTDKWPFYIGPTGGNFYSNLDVCQDKPSETCYIPISFILIGEFNFFSFFAHPK